MEKQSTEHGALTGDNHKALWSGRFAEGPDAAAEERDQEPVTLREGPDSRHPLAD